MNVSRDKLANTAFLRGAGRLLDVPAQSMWRHWRARFWILVIWILGIPLTTFCLMSMLSWAYGVDG